MNMQTLILDQIAIGVAADQDVLFIHDTQWSNAGTLRTLDKETLDQRAAVTYDFQHNYCHFGPVTDRVAALWYGQSTEGKAPWVKGSVPDLVDTVVAHLLGGC